MAARLCPTRGVIYNCSKAAVDAVTRTLSVELAGRGIRVNSVNPSFVDTEGLQATGFRKFLLRQVAAQPSGRLLQPAEVAEIIVSYALGPKADASGEISEVWPDEACTRYSST